MAERFTLVHPAWSPHTPPVKIVCASSVLLGTEAFSTLGTVVTVPGEAISPNVLSDADALIIRSGTKVDEALLKNSPVAFVGTATAGTNHLDIPYLEERGIAWSNAIGSNANSVSEYVTAAVLFTVREHGLLLDDLSIGIIGAGHVGSALEEKCRSMGMTVLLNDPPRRMKEDNPAFISLEALLTEVDIISLHVPLEDSGPFPTRHLADQRFFEQVQPGALFVNASRGEVVDSDALLAAFDNGTVQAGVLDVWEHEPEIRLDVLERVDLGTPHIAGYSHEGKLNGTLMLYEDACRFFEVEDAFDPAHHFPELESPRIHLDARGCLDQDVLWNAVQCAYDIREDDRQLREGAVSDGLARAAYFSGLRRNYGVRREFPAYEVALAHRSEEQQAKLSGLGFRVPDTGE